MIAAAIRAPLESACVALTAVSSEPSGEMTDDGLYKGIADPDGRFEITGVSPGKYQFRAEREAIFPETAALRAALRRQPCS